MSTRTDDVDGSSVDNHTPRTVVNWTLALLTVPGAGLVTVFWIGAVMGTAGCTNVACGYRGPGEFLFGVLAYGPPVVAVLTIALSFFTSKRRRGILVPMCGWALLIADVAVLAFSFG